MDDDLANTIYNLNSMIDTANTTISNLAGKTPTITSQSNNFNAAYECIRPGNIKCDKDKIKNIVLDYFGE
jgi:hypothetical protein